MGKAALDLPDPLQTPHDAGKALTSTDDLLSQLAGEEIDRLLAEVDEPAARPPGPLPIELPASIPADSAPDAAPPAAAEADPAPAADPDAAELARSAGPDVTAELDAFFKSAVKASVPEEAPLAETPSALAPALPADGAAGAGELAETSAAERAGLNDPPAAPLDAPAQPASDPADLLPAAEAAEGPLPLYLRPLEWINAPLEACPSALRDLIGKIAIITLVNASAVIAYVMIFRRH